MQGVLSHLDGAVVNASSKIRWERFFSEQFEHLTRFFPLWAVPNLSVRHGLPLAPAIIDMVIVDEASQCDVASIVPLLYRAKRATIIGDPNQLQPVHRLNRARNQHLLKKHGLLDTKYMQCDFLQNSAFAVASCSLHVATTCSSGTIPLSCGHRHLLQRCLLQPYSSRSNRRKPQCASRGGGSPAFSGLML